MGLFLCFFFWYDINTVKDRRHLPKTENNISMPDAYGSGCSYKLLHLVVIGSNYTYKHRIYG